MFCDSALCLHWHSSSFFNLGTSVLIIIMNNVIIRITSQMEGGGGESEKAQNT